MSEEFDFTPLVETWKRWQQMLDNMDTFNGTLVEDELVPQMLDAFPHLLREALIGRAARKAKDFTVEDINQRCGQANRTYTEYERGLLDASTRWFGYTADALALPESSR